MGILKALGDFILGKDPDIFDDKGQVRHKFTDQKWSGWNDRFLKNSEYDWRKHTGKARGAAATEKSPAKN